MNCKRKVKGLDKGLKDELVATGSTGAEKIPSSVRRRCGLGRVELLQFEMQPVPMHLFK